jgi:hypothetical protein
MRLRYKIFGILAMLLGVFLFGRYWHQGTKGLTNPTTSAKLPAQDKEQIIVNPENHTLTIVTPTKTTIETLPDRKSTIDIGKDDSVTIHAPQFGLEVRPFGGVFYSNSLRWGAGIQGAYFKKLDLGLGIAGAARTDTVVFAQLSYNVVGSLQLGLTYDNQKHVGAGITLRI